MRRILCLSTSNYYPFPTRKQNVMNRMKDAEIIYIDPPVTWIAPLKDKKAKARIRAYKNGGVKPEGNEHITVYAAPPVLPFFNKDRRINEINQKKLAKYIARLVKTEHGWDDDFWLWVYSPTAADIVAPLAKQLGIPAAALWKRTVYDCVDRHSAYPGMIDPAVVDGEEEDLARSCGCVFATAQGLYDRLSAFNPNCHFVPNGASYELFSQVASAGKSVKETIFGFVGMLQECTDYDVLRKVAADFPEVKLQFIGRQLPGVDLSWMKDYPNMELKGLVPQTELPGLMKEFDLCMNVFADNELSKDVSPLKFYEYLATGKPVVSTPVPYQVRDFENCIYIASDPADFSRKCREALEEKADDPRRAERMRQAKLCSWDERVRSMKQMLGWEQEDLR